MAQIRVTYVFNTDDDRTPRARLVERAERIAVAYNALLMAGADVAPDAIEVTLDGEPVETDAVLA